MSAYSKALAWESVPDCIRSNWDADSRTYSGVTSDDLERFARTVAYKVAHNLRVGHTINCDMDPLNYMGCDPLYPRNPCFKTIKT